MIKIKMLRFSTLGVSVDSKLDVIGILGGQKLKTQII